MKNDKRSSVSISVYLRWPLILAGLVLIMNLLLIALSPETAIYMAIFTVLFIAIAVWIYFYSKRGLFGGLVQFAQGFDNVQKRLMNDMNLPYVICDGQGYIIWGNRSFKDMLEAEHVSASHIQAIFPDITKEILAEQDEAAFIHSAFGRSLRMMMT